MTIIKTVAERKSRPFLNIDLMNSRQLPGWHPFTRNSRGTYLGASGNIMNAEVNEPRFDHHPETVEPKGLLVENSVTNYMTDYRIGISGSANPSFNSGNVSLVSLTYGTGETLSPAGDFSATLMAANGGSGVHRIVSQSNPISGSGQTFSIYVKAKGTNRVSIDCDNIGVNVAYFLSGDGSIHGTPANSNGKVRGYFIEKWPGDWYRIGVTLVNAGSGSGNDFRLYLANNTHSTSFTPGAATGTTESVYVWGAQLENDFLASSLIKSVGGATTRGQDLLSDGSTKVIFGTTGADNAKGNTYLDFPQPSQQGLTFYLHGEIDWQWNNGTNYYFFSLNAGGGSDYFGFRIGGSSGCATFQVYNNGSYNTQTHNDMYPSAQNTSAGAASDSVYGEHGKREFKFAGTLDPITSSNSMRSKMMYIQTRDNHYTEDVLTMQTGSTNPALPGVQGYGQLNRFGLVGSGQVLRRGWIKKLTFWSGPMTDDELEQLVET